MSLLMRTGAYSSGQLGALTITVDANAVVTSIGDDTLFEWYRLNSDSDWRDDLEGFIEFSRPVSNVRVLAVGGGGAGGGSAGSGGGGAGRFIDDTFSFDAGKYDIVTAGSEASNNGEVGNNGRATTIKLGSTTVVEMPGGGGGARSTTAISKANDGGSGGGGNAGASGSGNTTLGGAAVAGTPAGLGHAGGRGNEPFLRGGGGGAGGAGQDGNAGGNGGAPAVSNITGSNVNYADGGRGEGDNGASRSFPSSWEGTGCGGQGRISSTNVHQGGSGSVRIRLNTVGVTIIQES